MPIPQYKDTGVVKVPAQVNLESLRGKSAVITGGGSGLGKAYADAFCRAGAFVTIADYDEVKGKAAAAEFSPNAQFVRCDVRNWDDQVAVFEAAASSSPSKSVDIVIANAGIVGADDLFMLLDPASPPVKPDLRIVEINLLGTAYTAKLALHYFRRQPEEPSRDRCLIIKGSIAAYADQPGSPQYNMSKWGARGLFRNLRRTAWREGIRVNMTAPWVILTILHSEQASSLLDSPQGQIQLEMCHSQLDRWRDKALESFLIPAYTAGISKSLLLFTKMMYIYYHTAKARLCFRLIIASMTGPDGQSVPHGAEARCVETQSDMSISLHNIAEDLAELSHDGLVMLLPNTFVAFSAFPLLWAILETNVIGDDAPSSVSQRDLNTCVHVMQVFKGRYQSAENVLRCIKTTVQLVKDKVPSRELDLHTLSGMDKGEVRPNFGLARENVWVHLLFKNPNVYYQIARMVDSSFSKGRILAADWNVSRELCDGEEDVDYASRLVGNTYSYDQLLDMALGFIYGDN